MRSKAGVSAIVIGLAGVLAATQVGAAQKALDAGQVALEFNRRSWQHEHGLTAGDRVYAIRQTRDGYLWLATQYGLARFDGRTFTVFDHVTTPELADEDCRTLAEDPEGNLWIGTRTGVLRRSGNRFTSFNGKLGSHPVTYPPLCASAGGGMWVAGRGFICRIQGDAVKIHAEGQRLPIRDGVPTSLKEDKAGILWVGTSGGLARFDPKTQRFEVSTKWGGLERRPVQDIWQAPGGELWLLFAESVPEPGALFPATWLARLDPARWPEGPVAEERSLTSGWSGRFIAGDADGSMWLAGGRDGVCRYRKGQLELLPILSRLEEDASQCVFPDREGNLWVGTDKAGLERWTPRNMFTYTTQNGLAHDNVWSVWEGRDGGVWVGTDGGVTRFEHGQARVLRRADGSVHKDVRAVVEDAEGALWVGTMRSLECIRDGITTQVELPGEWFETKIRALQPGRDGSLWVGTVRGLTRLHKEQRTKYTTADGLGSEEVRAMLEDRAGDLWVGTFGGGLSRLHAGRFTTLTTTNGLSSNNVWALHEDADGVLWIGTDNGLSCYADGRLTTFTKTQGLPTTLVNCLVSDNQGRLWVGHDRGIYTLEKAELREAARKPRSTLTPVSYDESDGMLSVETNGQKSNPSACRTRDGRLWFPTVRGVAVIDPSKIGPHPVPPLAAIQEVRANGDQVFGDTPEPAVASGGGKQPKSQGLDLAFRPGGARVLGFHYTANTFVAPEKAAFKYRLLGLDDHWIHAGTQRQAYFTDLRPGTYRFELIACNHHGVWQQRGASLAFYIAPFYYQTWWFYLACGTATVTLLALVIAWRVRELHKIYELQRTNALNEQRRRIARDIHDELGASLTHIMRLSEQARKSAPGTDGPGVAAQRIASIAGEAVDNISEIVWANNPEYDTLEDLVAYVREHAAGFFADTGINVRFDFPETVPPRTVTGLFRRHFVLVMKEALQNIVKHAGAHEVNIRLSAHGNLLVLSIADDGCGFNVAGARPSGNGLTNMRQRIEELQGTLEVETSLHQGTKIRLAIPLLYE
ncbi:MAG TPA: two-component regulator propeller domain-containing protein [Verrucomicrobiae bacterium]